jgi:opacity protein-like surface antigen
MKKLLLFSMLAAVLTGSAFSQEVEKQAELQAELQAKYEKKIAKEFISYGNWMLDYDAARAKAKAEGKLLFTYFTRSYSP